jgi:hypothetical protein
LALGSELDITVHREVLSNTVVSRPNPLHPVRDWTAACPVIDPDRILRVHRYTKPENVRPVIRKTAQFMAQRAAEIAFPQASWLRVPIASNVAEVLTLADGTCFRCEAFDRFLNGASEVVVFVITLGPRFDEAVCALIEAFEPLEALFLESAGWLAIERLSTQFGSHLRRELASDGLRLGMRMGPGYSYSVHRPDGERVMWPLEQQKELFSLFGTAALPVELMQSAAMKPKMSRSGLFAVLPSEAGTI